jgi:putative flavoprotein involved in K+ transport
MNSPTGSGGQPDYDVVVVGAGQAGLAMAYTLQQSGRSFVVLERGRVGETWRAQRWDSFKLNTPNSMNGLPGAPYDGPESDAFWTRDDLVDSFDRYADRFDLPIRTGVTVESVKQTADGFEVRHSGNDGVMTTSNVVLASGILQTPRIPALRTDLPSWVDSMHTADYRNPELLAEGAVVVVGGGQSACQVAEDLLEGGREVFVCASAVGRFPRRYRGREIVEWWEEMGFWDVRLADLEDPMITRAAQPLVSGVGRYGRSISLQQLAAQGVQVRGRALAVEGNVIRTDEKLPEYIRFADEKSAWFKSEIDKHIERTGVQAPPPEYDPADVPAAELADAPTTIDLQGSGVGTVIFCTGFTADFSWIEPGVTDDEGRPVHDRGVSEVPGIYFLGFPWLATRRSGIIDGVARDAEYLAEEITERLEG